MRSENDIILAAGSVSFDVECDHLARPVASQLGNERLAACHRRACDAGDDVTYEQSLPGAETFIDAKHACSLTDHQYATSVVGDGVVEDDWDCQILRNLW